MGGDLFCRRLGYTQNIPDHLCHSLRSNAYRAAKRVNLRFISYDKGAANMTNQLTRLVLALSVLLAVATVLIATAKF